MKLISGSMIKSSMHTAMPNRIAVAYIGADWKEYICEEHLSEIIVSPTIGSNPYAIRQLVARLGWDNVYFLDNLHSKMYLGKKHALVGSFNLSANALSAESLEEAGFIVEDSETLQELSSLFERYKSLANFQYPTLEKKLLRLQGLQDMWNSATSTQIIRNDKIKSCFLDYEPLSDDDFYVCCTWGDVEYNEEIIGRDIDDAVIKDYVAFLETDELKKNRWILCWSARNDGLPDERSTPYWIYIDDIVPQGAKDTVYTKLAISRSDRVEPQRPFELEERDIKAMRAVLGSGRFPEFLGNYSEEWSIAPTIPRFRQFIDAVKSEIHGSDDKRHHIQPWSLLNKERLPRKVLRSVRPEVLEFASKVLPEVDRTSVGKAASWATHLLLSESGQPLDYASMDSKRMGGTATEKWIYSRLNQLGKNGHRFTLQLLKEFSNTLIFGSDVRYWAERASIRLYEYEAGLNR